MKQIFTLFIGIIAFFGLIDNNVITNNINNYIEKDYYKNNEQNYYIGSNLDVFKSNKYLKDDMSNYIDMTDNFYPSNKQELLNVYYTILNNGWEKFSFYCSRYYKNCLNDIEVLSKNSEEFSNINQLVNPYNSFASVLSNYENGRIDVTIKNKYSEKEISIIDGEINRIIDELGINSTKSIKEKIRLFHDYIANNNVYDSDKENKNSSYHSDTAIGTLFEGYSICSGYTDTMALFLDKINLPNYKIATDDHTWNAVLINNKWYHIDLTWDDPIVNTGENIIQYDYFLITTDELKEKNDGEHLYNEAIYDFLK